MTDRPVLHLWAPDSVRPILGAVTAPLGERVRPRIEAGIPEPEAIAEDEFGLLLCEGLDEVLDHDLAQSGSAARGLALWTAQVQDCLAAFARTRRRLILLPTAALRRAPEAVFALLAERAGLGADSAAPEMPCVAGPSPDAALMAAAILQTSPEAAETLGRLEAACTPVADLDLSGAMAPADLGALRDLMAAAAPAPADAPTEQPAALRERDDRIAALATELQSLEAEIQKIQLEADRQQAELEARHERLLEAEGSQRQSEAQRRAKAEWQVVAFRTQIDETETRLKETEGLNKTLEARIARLEEALAAREAERDRARAEIASLGNDIRERDERERALAAEIVELRASHSWRVTAPLRAVSLAARRLKPGG